MFKYSLLTFNFENLKKLQLYTKIICVSIINSFNILSINGGAPKLHDGLMKIYAEQKNSAPI